MRARIDDRVILNVVCTFAPARRKHFTGNDFADSWTGMETITKAFMLLVAPRLNFCADRAPETAERRRSAGVVAKQVQEKRPSIG